MKTYFLQPDKASRLDGIIDFISEFPNKLKKYIKKSAGFRANQQDIQRCINVDFLNDFDIVLKLQKHLKA